MTFPRNVPLGLGGPCVGIVAKAWPVALTLSEERDQVKPGVVIAGTWVVQTTSPAATVVLHARPPPAPPPLDDEEVDDEDVDEDEEPMPPVPPVDEALTPP